jgi:hypothetical protein
VGLEADGHVDVRGNALAALVVGEVPAAEGLDVLQVDLRPDRCPGIVEFVAGTDEVDLGEAGDERGDVALPDVGAAVDADGERTAEWGPPRAVT